MRSITYLYFHPRVKIKNMSNYLDSKDKLNLKKWNNIKLSTFVFKSICNSIYLKYCISLFLFAT